MTAEGVAGIPSRAYRVNDQIRVREVLVIGQNGDQIGTIPTQDALEMAREQGVDLVEVAPQAVPPVCRFMDYGRFRYSQAKKEREAKKGQRSNAMREVRFRTRTAENDQQSKIRRIQTLLSAGSKVKVQVRFRGREITHPEFGIGMLRNIAEQLKEQANLEAPPAMEGRQLSIVLTPSAKKDQKPTQQEEEQENLNGEEDCLGR